MTRRTSWFATTRPRTYPWWVAAAGVAAAALPLAVASARAAEPAPSLAAGPVQATALTYELVDTWADRTNTPGAGRFVAPSDVTSRPDGTRCVPDMVFGPGTVRGGFATLPALHVLEADGAPRSLWDLSASFTAVRRADAHTDGSLWLLGDPTGTARQGLVHLAADGSVITAWPLTRAMTAVDVAVAPDGSVYVSYQGPSGVVVRYTPDGQEITVIDPIALGVNGQPDPFVYLLGHLDVDAQGRVYVLSIAVRDCPGPPVIGTPPAPPATPTPRPSLAGDGAPAQALEPPCRKDTVLVFQPAPAFEREVAWLPLPSDLAPAPDGVWVVRSEAGEPDGRELWLRRLDRDRPGIRLRPTARKGSVVGYSAGVNVSLDIGPEGRADGVLDALDPFYPGAFTFGQPDAAPGTPGRAQAPLGQPERPPLAGPARPSRLGITGDTLLLLDAAWQPVAGQPRTTVDYRHDLSMVQRWSLAGQPLGQVAHVGYSRLEETRAYNVDGPLVDVAPDGDATFAVSEHAVWYRSDALWPTWYRRTFGTRFIAGSADGGRLALLDVAGERVFLLDRRGDLLGSWSIAGARAVNAPSDLALDGDRVLLADQGQNRILVRGLDGAELGEWTTHDGPWRVAAGPGGDTFVLGRGGWGLRYTADGGLVAAWRLPTTHQGVPVSAQDLAVGADGRVYVSFVGLSLPTPEDGWGYRIDAGGVWVFAPAPAPEPPPPPDPGACVAVPDKRAGPSPLLLGEPVDVRLTVQGQCPGRAVPHQLLIVLDTSWSMDDEYPGNLTRPGGLRRAKTMLDALLATMDPTLTDVGLVTFNDGGELRTRLTSDLSAVRAELARLAADGNTRMGAGVDLARTELTGPRAKPGAARTLLLVSDGVFKDDPADAISRARAGGIDVQALVYTTTEFTPALGDALVAMLGDPGKLHRDLPPEAAASLIHTTGGYLPNPWLFRSATVVDTLPDDMEYVVDSAVPAAAWDPGARRLSWQVADLRSADGLRLTYRVIPRQVGDRPTNVVAGVTYRDGLDRDGSLVFPVPRVYVLQPNPLATPSPTPTSTATVAPTITPSPTATPLPRTHRIYLTWAGKDACFVGLKPVDIVLVHDHSSTMGEPSGDGASIKLDRAREAARVFLGLVQWHKDRVAVVQFDETAERLVGFTGQRAAAEAALDQLAVGWGTRIDLGLAETVRVVTEGARPEAVTVVVLLSDGLQNGAPDPVYPPAAALKAGGALVYTIALGENADTGLMAALATAPGHAYVSPSVADLKRIYAEVATVIQPCR